MRSSLTRRSRSLILSHSLSRSLSKSLGDGFSLPLKVVAGEEILSGDEVSTRRPTTPIGPTYESRLRRSKKSSTSVVDAAASRGVECQRPAEDDMAEVSDRFRKQVEADEADEDADEYDDEGEAGNAEEVRVAFVDDVAEVYRGAAHACQRSRPWRAERSVGLVLSFCPLPTKMVSSPRISSRSTPSSQSSEDGVARPCGRTKVSSGPASEVSSQDGVGQRGTCSLGGMQD